jgi:hypothetical protein
VKAAFGLVAGIVRGLSPSPVVLAIAVIVVALAGLATLTLIVRSRYSVSYKTVKGAHLEFKPVDPPDKKQG